MERRNLIPVFINGDRSKVFDYRPVSVVSKVIERCIYQNGYKSVKDIINPLQHGFIGDTSCAT